MRNLIRKVLVRAGVIDNPLPHDDMVVLRCAIVRAAGDCMTFQNLIELRRVTLGAKPVRLIGGDAFMTSYVPFAQDSIAVSQRLERFVATPNEPWRITLTITGFGQADVRELAQLRDALRPDFLVCEIGVTPHLDDFRFDFTPEGVIRVSYSSRMDHYVPYVKRPATVGC